MSTASPPISLVIVALGQEMRGDDAAGLALARAWQTRYPQTAGDPRVRVELAGLPGLGLLDLLAGTPAAILLDAVRSGAAPGTLHVFGPDEVAAFTPGSASAHGWGAAETLALGRVLDPLALPTRLMLIGLEAGDLTLGAGLTPAVQARLPEAAEVLEAEVRRWI